MTAADLASKLDAIGRLLTDLSTPSRERQLDLLTEVQVKAEKLASDCFQVGAPQGLFPKHWRKPSLEKREGAMIVRLGVMLPRAIDLYGSPQDLWGVASERWRKRFRASRKPEAVVTDLKVEEVVQLTGRAHQRFVATELLKIVVHATLHRQSLESNDVVAATAHASVMFSAFHEAWCLMHHRELRAGAKLGEISRRNYGGEGAREVQRLEIAQAIRREFTRASSKGPAKLSSVLDAVVQQLGVCLSTVKRAAKEHGIKRASLVQDLVSLHHDGGAGA